MSKCIKCGAEIEYEANSQALKCPYCDTVNTIEKAEDKLPDAVDKIIPLKLSLDDLEKKVYGFMASGNYTPDDMLEASAITKRESFYAPAYIFSVEYEATWTASFGYDRKEPYTAHRSVTRNGRTYQEAYTAYRTVTDWRPSNGVDKGVFSVSIYAGDILCKSGLNPAELVPNAIANGSITSFNESFVKNIKVEDFSVSNPDAFDALDGKINSVIDNKVKNHAQGDHQKDWHWNAQMRHSSNTINVPICHAVFDYNGQEYHYWIDGIGTEEYRATKLPEDEQRKQLVFKGFVPAVVAIVCLIGTSFSWGFSWFGLVVCLMLFGYAAIRKSSIIDYSKSIRTALLTQMQASSINTSDLSNDEREKLSKAFQRPEKPIFAKTNRDNALIPALVVLAIFLVATPSYIKNQTLHNKKAGSAKASANQVENTNNTANSENGQIDTALLKPDEKTQQTQVSQPQTATTDTVNYKQVYEPQSNIQNSTSQSEAYPANGKRQNIAVPEQNVSSASDALAIAAEKQITIAEGHLREKRFGKAIAAAESALSIDQNNTHAQQVLLLAKQEERSLLEQTQIK